MRTPVLLIVCAATFAQASTTRMMQTVVARRNAIAATATTTTAATTSTTTTLLDPDLSLWYEFATSSTPTPDSSTNGNDGTVTATVWTSAYGGAYEFNGSTAEIDVGNNSLLDGSTAFTLSAWIKPDDAGTIRRIFGRWGGSNRKISWWRHTDNRIGLGTSSTGSDVSNLYSTETVTTNWAHVAVTFDAGTVAHYINGVAGGGSSSGKTPINTHDSAYLVGFLTGGSPASRHFDGLIDDFRVYDRTLTAPEVAAVYHGTAPAHSRHMDIFVFYGQSNVCGRPDDTNMLGSAQLNVAGAESYLWDNDDAQVGAWGAMTPYATNHWGAEQSWARLLVSSSTNRVGILKVCNGGWGLEDQWIPGQTGWGLLTNHYANMITALDARTDLDSYTIQAAVFQAGANDAQDESEANNYWSNLTNMIATFRTEVADVPFIVPRLYDYGPLTYKETVRAAQMDVTNLTDCAWFDTDEILTKPGDGAHYSGEGLIEFGDAIAAELIDQGWEQ